MKLFLGNCQDVVIDVDEIQVFPMATACGGVYDITDKNAWVSRFWIGIKGSLKYFYYATSNKRKDCYSKEDAEKAARLHYKNNNINTKESIITVNVADIDENVMKHFRYIQPMIDYPFQEVPVDPYFFGAWCGDGHKDSTGITNVDEAVIKYVYDHAESLGMKVSRSSKSIDYFTIKGDLMTGAANPLLNKLRALDVIENKHIPKVYLENSKEVRLAVLSGICDTDGSLAVNLYEIVQKLPRLAADIVTLANSLGFFCHTVDKLACATNTEKKTKRIYKRTHLYPNYQTPDIPVLIDYKRLDKTDMVITGVTFSLEKTKESHKHTWTDEMKEQFAATVLKYTVGNRVQWTKLVANEDMYKEITANAMRQHNTIERKKIE